MTVIVTIGPVERNGTFQTPLAKSLRQRPPPRVVAPRSGSRSYMGSWQAPSFRPRMPPVHGSPDSSDHR